MARALGQVMRHHIENVIRKIGGEPMRQRAVADLRYIVLHRFGSHDLEWYDEQGIAPTALGVAKFYQRNPEACAATGGHMPYTFVVGQGGGAWQARALTDVTPHSKRFNTPGIGVAFLGDFRLLPPTRDQWNVGVDMCAALRRLWPHLQIVGHTGLGAEATSDPGKQCPGRMFDVTDFAAEVQSVIDAAAGMHLLSMGVAI